MSPIVEGGRATRSMSLAPPLESQDVSRYQAIEPTFLGPASEPLAWRRALPLFAAFAVLCVALFTPREIQVGVAAGTFLAALAALWRLL